jgi:hypothetical protein
MQNLVSELEQILKIKNAEKKSSNAYSRLDKINDKYNKMVKNGSLKKRGYTLRGIEDTHLINIRFNS